MNLAGFYCTMISQFLSHQLRHSISRANIDNKPKYLSGNNVEPSPNNCCYGNKTILYRCTAVALRVIYSAVSIMIGPQLLSKASSTISVI